MASELTVDGYDAILQRLAGIEDKLRDKVSKAALRAGATVIQESIAAEVHVSNHGDEHIRDDIQVGHLKRTDTGWTISVGPGKKTAWRAKFLEFGHMKPKGQGKVPAYPFMEPGLARSREKFMTAVADVVRREL